jgi:mannose-6-phosphate isomerase-like protein (cupin superfamily)
MADVERRPWGQFQVLCEEAAFKAKRITVLPGAQISYQSHKHREERWIFVGGQGEVVLDEKIIPVKIGDEVRIPIGAKHRIRNTGKENIDFIEVQFGTYFGEDDITRYSDDYGRA